jgi:hypothetical protein
VFLNGLVQFSFHYLLALILPRQFLSHFDPCFSRALGIAGARKLLQIPPARAYLPFISDPPFSFQVLARAFVDW